MESSYLFNRALTVKELLRSDRSGVTSHHAKPEIEITG